MQTDFLYLSVHPLPPPPNPPSSILFLNPLSEAPPTPLPPSSPSTPSPSSPSLQLLPRVHCSHKPLHHFAQQSSSQLGEIILHGNNGGHSKAPTCTATLRDVIRALINVLTGIRSARQVCMGPSKPKRERESRQAHLLSFFGWLIT